MNNPANTWQFSRNTRIGALVLLVILIAIIVLWRLLPMWVKPPPAADDKQLQAAWTAFAQDHIEAAPEEQQHYTQHTDRSRAKQDATGRTGPPPRPVPFNPNTASESELVAVGFSPRTAATMLKYRSKGGRFRKKEDLQKLYTLSPADYERIAPYARFEDAATPNADPYPERTAYTERPGYTPRSINNRLPRILELNTADADALLSLRGIGPAFSKRILNFRNALGGFVSVEQLKEVYGMPDSTFQQLNGSLRVDAGKIVLIHINEADEATLAKHPYIGRRLAIGIIKMRNELGKYSDLEQLKQVPLLNDEKYRKIAPYLSTH